MPVCQERLNRTTKCHYASVGRGMCVRICQQVGPPWLRGLISSNMFLTHAEGSSAQIISPSAVKSFQFSTPHLWGIAPLPLPLGSMFHQLRSSESLILLLHSLGIGSQNISRTFIPLFPFYYFPRCQFPTSQDIKEKPTPKQQMSQFPFLHLPGPL